MEGSVCHGMQLPPRRNRHRCIAPRKAATRRPHGYRPRAVLTPTERAARHCTKPPVEGVMT